MAFQAVFDDAGTTCHIHARELRFQMGPSHPESPHPGLDGTCIHAVGRLGTIPNFLFLPLAFCVVHILSQILKSCLIYVFLP
jgi:hypothetical protein